MSLLKIGNPRAEKAVVMASMTYHNTRNNIIIIIEHSLNIRGHPNPVTFAAPSTKIIMVPLESIKLHKA